MPRQFSPPPIDLDDARHEFVLQVRDKVDVGARRIIRLTPHAASGQALVQVSHWAEDVLTPGEVVQLEELLSKIAGAMLDASSEYV
jgi:hypothetical protein